MRLAKIGYVPKDKYRTYIDIKYRAEKGIASKSNTEGKCQAKWQIYIILTTLTRDIQCEKFIEDKSVSHEPFDSMYPNIY